jgi:hypothetical protein
VCGGAQTCGVHRGRLAPGAGAPHVEGSHVDDVALPGQQLDQRLAGRDAHKRPGRGVEPDSVGRGHRSQGFVTNLSRTHCPLDHSSTARLSPSLLSLLGTAVDHWGQPWATGGRCLLGIIPLIPTVPHKNTMPQLPLSLCLWLLTPRENFSAVPVYRYHSSARRGQGVQVTLETAAPDRRATFAYSLNRY